VGSAKEKPRSSVRNLSMTLLSIAGLAISLLGLGWTLVEHSYAEKNENVPRPARLCMRGFGIVFVTAGTVILIKIALTFMPILPVFAALFTALGAGAYAGYRARACLRQLLRLRRSAVKVAALLFAVSALATGAITWALEARGSREAVPLMVIKPPTTSPAILGSDRSVHVSFTLKNTGGSARRLAGLDVVAVPYPSGDETHFPDIGEVTVSPGQTKTYTGTKVFPHPGTYGIWARAKLGGEWEDLGPHIQMTIVPMPSQLEVVKPLTLSTWSPAEGEVVTATFVIENVSQQALDFRVTAAVHPPDDPDGKRPFDFARCPSVELQPGQVYPYRGSRSFPTGTYYVWPAVEMDYGWIYDLEPMRTLKVHAAATSPGTPPSEGTMCPP
jgi:hypothetical protein